MRLIFLLFVLFTSLDGKIIEIKNLAECKNHINSDMLVIFDLDNTIYEPVQSLGSDQWFGYRMAEYESRGFSHAEALHLTRAEWIAIQNVTKVKPVESTTRELIAGLQKDGWQMIGLTNRGLYLATKTNEQLHSIGVDLSKTAPLQQEMMFDADQGVLFRNGILFSAGTSKGDLLRRFFKEANVHPKRILFIDDKESQLKIVEKVCEEMQIPFVGLRYGFLDEKVQNLRKDLVQKQLEHFGLLISDEDAEAQLK